jgi:hypothetical protein
MNFDDRSDYKSTSINTPYCLEVSLTEFENNKITWSDKNKTILVSLVAEKVFISFCENPKVKTCMVKRVRDFYSLIKLLSHSFEC